MRRFDCCTTRGEMDLINLRLAELKGVVDVFVFVEADMTHSGLRRKMTLNAEKARLATSHGLGKDQIRIVEVRDMPTGSDPWERERHQRECIWRGLYDAKENDLIAFSDCDEIPSHVAWGNFLPSGRVSKMEQQFCYYWLNCFGGKWGGTIIGREGDLKQPLSLLRNSDLVKNVIPNGGWHFSFLGDVQGIKSKLTDYAHQDMNLPHYQDERWLRVAINTPIDIFRRAGCDWSFVDWKQPGLLPDCVLRNPKRWAHLYRDVSFGEKWISDAQICHMVDTYRRVIDLEGEVLELGSWEGRSAVALANMCYPERLHCIDTWHGQPDKPELGGGPRQVFTQFLNNVQWLTPSNVDTTRSRTQDYVESLEPGTKIKFAHIDASHHYEDVAHEIRHLIPHVVPGGVLCGDDFQSADRNRHDLNGGVQRAVEELCPGFEQIGNFWIWQRRT